MPKCTCVSTVNTVLSKRAKQTAQHSLTFNVMGEVMKYAYRWMVCKILEMSKKKWEWEEVGGG